MDSIEDTKKQVLNDRYLSSSLDFHSGILVALDSLKELGISLKVDVYDTRDEKSYINTLLRTKDFTAVDAVIGPLLNDNFKQVASELRDQDVPVISPLGKSIQLYSNVFQSRPNDEVLRDKLVDYVKIKKDSAHIIVISDSKNASVRDMLKREFPTASLINSRKNKSGEDLNYVTIADLEAALRPGKNMVFLETESAGFVSNVTSILNSKINEETQIVLMTTNMNDAFRDDAVSNHDLSNLQFHFATIARYNITENSNGFVERYVRKYGDTPSKIAVRGFDLTMDVVLRLVTSESLYTSVKDNELTEYVENKFSYKKELFGGYYNDSVYLVRYENLRIVEVQN
jgi:ABC-type branched-subunit amino acid transport system substrate-binding protein